MFLHLCVILFTGESASGGSASRRGVFLQGGVGRPTLSITEYGQQAGGTHPTGMHSCNLNTLEQLSKKNYVLSNWYSTVK